MSSTWTTVLLFHIVLLSSAAVTAQEEGYCDASNPNCQGDHIFEKLRNKLVVAAIDFGTTYSGWAYQTKSEYVRNKIDVKVSKWGSNDLLSKKTPTTVLIQPDGKTLEAFGYDAETRYSNLASEEQHTDFYYFRRFKMLLYGKKDLNQNTMLQDDKGKKLPAITVFSLAIGFLKDNLLGELQKTNSEFEMKDIHWVLTVPAIWNDTAKQFMRKSAVSAGIINEDLTIALEPEVASLYGRTLEIEKHTDANGKAFLNSFQPGKKYMVLDAGGGTIDITNHYVKLVNNRIRLIELYPPTGGPWGGTEVDKGFESILSTLMGEELYKKFKVKPDCAFDYCSLTRGFELMKRQVTLDSQNALAVTLPMCLREMLEESTGQDIKTTIEGSVLKEHLRMKYDRLKVSAELTRSFFTKPVEKITQHVSKLLTLPELKGLDTILLVGGFAESPILRSAVTSLCQGQFGGAVKVHIPTDPELAVLKGAIIYGFDPGYIPVRKARFTYGVKVIKDFIPGTHDEEMCKKFLKNGKYYCDTVFKVLVKEGDDINVGDVHEFDQPFETLSVDKEHVYVFIYSCPGPSPLFITEEGCERRGILRLKLPPKNSTAREITVKFEFGSSETTVTAIEKGSGNEVQNSMDFE